MTMKSTLIASAAILAALASTAQAQPPYPHPHGNIHQRLADQRARIRQGVHSGELTRREAWELRRRDARLTHQYHRDLRHDDGHLTPEQRRRLEHELSHSSHGIYHQKHDGQTR